MIDRTTPSQLCTVNQVVPLNDDVFGVRLTPIDPLSFYAGQYIKLLLPGHNMPYAFSIANAPNQQELELHIRKNPQEAVSHEIIHALQNNQTVEIMLPDGECILKEDPNKPLIFVAASTCFAQIKGLLEHAFHNNFSQSLYFYWGARKPHDFYLQNLTAQWVEKYSNFKFIPVVSERDASWQGRHGFVHKAVMHDFETLKDMQVYACGSPKMIYTVLDDFILHGINEVNFYSDVLDYSPR